MPATLFTTFDSERWGPITIGSAAAGVCLVHFGVARAGEPGDPFGVAAALQAYFAGALDALDALPVAAEGTDFQQACWAALRRIPPGTTTTYAALAKSLGRPTAVRAVGAANGANPVAIIVPCHRVIGAAGQLVGYAGGVEMKRRLLAHEGAPGFLVP